MENTANDLIQSTFIFLELGGMISKSVLSRERERERERGEREKGRRKGGGRRGGEEKKEEVEEEEEEEERLVQSLMNMVASARNTFTGVFM
jgi:ribosomal protein L19E